MVKSHSPALPGIKTNRTAITWWLADSLGAIPIAAGIALAVASKMRPDGGIIWPIALLVTGGCIRAMAVWRAQIAGQAAATAAKFKLGQKLHPKLLPSRLQRGRLIGEDNLLRLTRAHVMVVGVGGVQVPFTLDSKGRGISTLGTARLAYTKPTRTRK